MEIVPAGQTSTQSPQPIHEPGSMLVVTDEEQLVFMPFGVHSPELAARAGSVSGTINILTSGD
jgi:hypothetical protein